jgi:serine/threonine protein kinase
LPYPTFQQYNEALQYPRTALSDLDLQNGKVKQTGFGLPLALCGGFALTYFIETANGKYAVRCFHKESNQLQQRYTAITQKLKTIKSNYFLDFQFQQNGIRVNSDWFPVLKMNWADGETLGEFLEKSYSNRATIHRLISSLTALSTFLKSKSIAHGDIQPGNIMVSNGASSLQLIDYDGMYLDNISKLGSSELGLRNFQHPGRTSHSWDGSLDYFPFIALNVSLRALELKPSLWRKSQSDSEAFLFKANDYQDPERSTIFSELFNMPEISEDAKFFAAICKAPFSKVPTLIGFLQKQKIPQTEFYVKSTISNEQADYLSNYPVLNAAIYGQCFQFIGNRIELIGKITEIRNWKTKNKKPYAFINFGDWHGEIVQLVIWSESLELLTSKPDDTWIDEWVSVVGLLEPPYTNPKFSYKHICITITQSNQIHIITPNEAGHRLDSGWKPRQVTEAVSANKKILEEVIKTRKIESRISQTPQVTFQGQTNNQQILQNMKSRKIATQTPGTKLAVKPRSPSSAPDQLNKPQNSLQKPKQSSSSDHCFIASVLYGSDAVETNILRSFRDKFLLRSRLGQHTVNIYYKLSPKWVPAVKRNKIFRAILRFIIDRIVLYIKQYKS